MNDLDRVINLTLPMELPLTTVLPLIFSFHCSAGTHSLLKFQKEITACGRLQSKWLLKKHIFLLVLKLVTYTLPQIEPLTSVKFTRYFHVSYNIIPRKYYQLVFFFIRLCPIRFVTFFSQLHTIRRDVKWSDYCKPILRPTASFITTKWMRHRKSLDTSKII